MTNPSFQQAIQHEEIWKPGEMRDFAIALITAALCLHREGYEHFSTDNVPEHLHPASPGIAGSVIEKLKNAGLITSVGIWQDGKWYAERHRATRPSSRGRCIGRYNLISAAAAQAFLARHSTSKFPATESAGVSP